MPKPFYKFITSSKHLNIYTNFYFVFTHIKAIEIFHLRNLTHAQIKSQKYLIETFGQSVL